MLKKYLFLAVLAGLFLSVSNCLAQLQLDVKKQVLDNGLTILTVEDHSAPVVSYQVWFNVGSKNEGPGITGISHLFEHMMFKGSKNIGPEEHAKIVQANGGTLNAYTTNDNTTYFENLASDKLEIAVRLEAERQENLNITQQNLTSEREVVKEEKRLSDNSPFGPIIEQLYASAYIAHPYHWPVIGWMSDLDNITVSDCQNYFKTHYAPNNATVVIVGDFKTEEAVALVKKYYGHMSSQTPPPPVKTVEPEQKGERRVYYNKIAQLPAFVAGYHIPQIGQEDMYPLQVAARILSAGQSSRIYKKLVYEDQIALFAGGGADVSSHPGLFFAFALMQPGHPIEKGEEELYAELEKLKTEPIPEKELQKAKNQLEAEYIQGLQSVSQKASKIGFYHTLAGDYRLMSDEAQKYQKVTAEDVQRVAKKYLDKNNRTVVVLVPEMPQMPGMPGMEQ